MGDTGKLALGTAKFGQKYGISNKFQQPEEHEISKILEFARTNGILTIDTAMDYGSSEDILGKIGISGFSTVTKLSPLPKYEVNIYLCPFFQKFQIAYLQLLIKDRTRYIFYH